MYEYKAKVVKVVDGDTVDCDVDLGFYMTARIRFRLARIDTPEIRGEERPEGLLAKQWLIDTLQKSNNEITVQTGKTGKYGRWIGEIIIGETNINDELVKTGHAEYTSY
jgi:micrococcal nuclease